MRDEGLTVFGLWSDHFLGLEVDVFVKEPFEFGEAYRRALRVDLDTTSAMVVCLEDLLALKLAAGRPLDVADVEALRALSLEKDR
jgi:predicted nucleotidyltransferase